MLIEKLFPSGAWECTDIVDGEYYRQTYYGYTKKEALTCFKEYLTEMENE